MLSFSDIFEIKSDAPKFASLSNVKVAVFSKQCHPLHVELQSQVYAHQQVILPGVLELHNLSISVTIETKLESVLIDIAISGVWAVGSTVVHLNMMYRHNSSEFSLSAKIDNAKQGIEDLVDELTTLSLPLASRLISSHQNFKIAGRVDHRLNGIVVISASTDPLNTAFLILQRDNGTLETAVAVDIASVSLSDVIESVTGQDISSVPVIGSLTLPEMGLALSTGPISSEVVEECFNDSQTLRCYGDSLPSHLSGFARLTDNNIFEFSYHNNTASFAINKGSMKIESLLQLITDKSHIQIPFEFKDINIMDFGLDLTRATTVITAEFGRTLSFFNGLLLIETSSVTMSAVESNFRYDIAGRVRLLDTLVDINMGYSQVSNRFTFFSELSAPSLRIEDLVSGLPSVSLPFDGKLNFSHQGIKVAGLIDDWLNGVVIISATIDSVHNAFVILQRNNGTSNAAVAVDIDSASFSDVIESVTGRDMSMVPFVRHLNVLPEVGLTVSTGHISSELVQECLNGSLILRCYGDTIPAGLSGLVQLSASNIFQLAYHNNTAFFTIKNGSLSVENLFRLIPVTDVSNIISPSAITDILSVDIRDFGFNFVSETTFITAEFGRTLSFFNDLISIDTSSFTLTVGSDHVSYDILGNITIASTQLNVELSYSSASNMLTFYSENNAPLLSIEDLISELTSFSLPFANKFSVSNQRIKIAGSMDNESNGIVVISAFVDSNEVFLILQRDNGTLETAVAVDIASVSLSDVIESLTGQDISSVPFIGSLTLPEMGLALSTGPISSQLVQECFKDSLILQCYNETLPAGVSGFVRLNASNIFELAYHNSTASLAIKKGSVSIRSLLTLVPLVDLPSIQLPSVIRDVFDIDIKDFSFDLIKNTTSITAEFGRTLSFFDDLLLVDTSLVSMTTVDGSVVSFDFLGNITLENAMIDVKLSYSPGTGQFTLLSDLSTPSFSIVDLVSEQTSLQLPAAGKFSSSHQRIKIAGRVDDHLNGIAIISASLDSTNNAFLILQRDNGTLETAVAVDIASVPLSDVIESVTGLDVSSVPYLDSWMLPEMGLALSTGPISSLLLQECFDTSLSLRCYGGSIPTGLSGFVRLSANNIFELAYQNNIASFTIKRGSINVNDLLKLIPLVNTETIQLPSVIRDILDIDIKDFGFDLTSNTTFITVELGRTLSFFNGLLSIEAPSVTLTAVDGDFHFDILGNIRLLETLVSLKLSYSPTSNNFIFSSDLDVPSLSIGDLVNELTPLSLPMAGKFSSSHQQMKIAGAVDDRLNGIVVISASIDPLNTAFLILQRDNGTLETAVAVDIASVPLSDVIESVTGQDISSVPVIGSLTLPEMGLALSTGPISSYQVQECFNSSHTLRCYGNNIPPGLSGFISLSSDIIFTLLYHNDTTSFAIKEGSLNLRDLLESLPILDLSSIQLPSTITDILDVNIKDFGFDLISETTFITAEFGKTLSFFNDLLSIDTSSVTLTVVNDRISYDILGNITLASTRLDIELSYSSASDIFTFFSDVSAPSLSLGSLVSELTSLSLPLVSEFQSSHQRVKIAGSVDSQSSGIVIISVSIDSIHRAFLILEKDGDTLETAVALDIASIQLSDVIESVTGQDVSSLPFFGSITLPEMGLALSTDRISSQLFQRCFMNTMLLECYNITIPSGFSGFVNFDFASDVFSITHDNDALAFSTKDGELSVREVLGLVLSAVDFQRIRLPSIFADIFDIDISDFGMNLTSNDLMIDFDLGNTVEIFNGLIQITSPLVSLEVSLPDNDVSVEIRQGSIVLGEVDFSFSITEDTNENYILSANTDYISLLSILSSFSAKLLPVHLQQIIQSVPLLNSGIRDLSMVVPLDAAFQQVFLSGKPVIAGFSLVDMSATIFRDESGSVDMVYELDFGDTNFADILGEIAPFARSILRLIPLLDQDLDISVLFSPVQKSDIRLYYDDLASLAIKNGITIRTDITFPSDSKCNADLFCALAKSILPSDTVLHIDSTINNAASFQLIASLTGNIQIGGLTITHTGVELRVGEDTSIGIIGKMSLQNPRLDFTIRAYLSPTGLVLEMIAAGCWHRAFGLPIDICDVHGSIGIGATVITEISYGGRIQIGGLLGCNVGRPLIAEGHIGLNTIEPRNNYYFASFPQGLTISNLLEIFCIDVSAIPPPIANSGLEPGFQTSFTAGVTGKSIPEIDLYIPPGFQLNGTLNIFGFRVSANITVDHMEGLYAAVALDPLEVGSLFQMYASSSDTTRGPYLIADLRANRVSVEASGYLSVLGISVGASLFMSAETISASIEGSILGIVEASLTVTSPYSPSFSELQFEVEGTFKSALHETIQDAIRNAASSIADSANVALDAAQSVLNAASNAFDEASAVFANARRELDRVQGEFDNAANEVNSLIDRVDSVCSTRSCGSSKLAILFAFVLQIVISITTVLSSCTLI